MSQTVTTAGFSSRPFRVWMTGLTINATAASRTAITTTPQKGFVLVQDPYGHDNKVDPAQAVSASVEAGYNSKHIDFTRPTTGYLNQCKVLIVNVPPSTASAITNGTASSTGGWVDVVVQDIQGIAYCHANATIGDVLAVANGEYSLVAATVFAATNMATFLTLGAKCGVSLVTSDTSSTAANRKVNFNGGGIV